MFYYKFFFPLSVQMAKEENKIGDPTVSRYTLQRIGRSSSSRYVCTLGHSLSHNNQKGNPTEMPRGQTHQQIVVYLDDEIYSAVKRKEILSHTVQHR